MVSPTSTHQMGGQEGREAGTGGSRRDKGSRAGGTGRVGKVNERQKSAR